MPVLLLAAGCSPSPHTDASRSSGAPALVVLVVVDQMRGDYLDRFAAEWRGGFRDILKNSALFAHGMQDHAITETAPGHATILSGREPLHTRTWSNEHGVADNSAPLINVPGVLGASPTRFSGTTLFDWMRAADSKTQVLSVSRKDRGAILPIGRARADVYWFARGQFTTSTYYRDTLPRWVAQFNSELAAAAIPSTWTLMRPPAEYHEPDSMSFEHAGVDFTFPHQFLADPVQRLALLEDIPWMDSVTLAFAWRGMRTLGLGTRDGTDLLSVSLSTTDKVGHTYGPDSREMHDHLLRLDAWLGQFLDSLAIVVPRDRMILVLTSDHGIPSMPEYFTRVLMQPATRIDINRAIKGNTALRFDNGLITVNRTLFQRQSDVDKLADSLARAIAGMQGVARTFTPRSLAVADTTDPAVRRWRNNLSPDIDWVVAAVAQPGHVFAGVSVAEHGTMSEESVGVPIAFMGFGIAPRRLARPVRTVDIAPTLAQLLQLTPPESLDGVPIPEISEKRVAPQTALRKN